MVGLETIFLVLFSLFLSRERLRLPGLFFFSSISHPWNSLGFTEPARYEGGHLPKIRLGSPRGNSGFGPLAKDDGLRRAGATFDAGTAATPRSSEGHPASAGVVDGGSTLFYIFLVALSAAFWRRERVLLGGKL
jgi:hypothetical protein